MNRKVHVWNRRKETIYEPLFSSFVFAQLPEDQLPALEKMEDVLHVVQWKKKPALVHDTEIRALKHFLEEHENVHFSNIHQKTQNTGSVPKARLVDVEGTVIPINYTLTKVSLPSLGILLYARQKAKSYAKAM